MEKSPEEILEVIKQNIQNGLPTVMRILNIDISDPESKEKHSEILLSGWQSVKNQFFRKWVPEMKYNIEEDVVTYLKQEKSIHSVYDFVKNEYRDNVMQSLGLDTYIVSEIDPDVFDKLEELSFEANIAYNTVLSIMNEQLEIILAVADENDAVVREKIEDYWLNDVYERVMIEFIQYGKAVVEELDEYAKSKDYFDGFDKDMMHDVYKRLFEEKMSEIKMIREISKTA